MKVYSAMFLINVQEEEIRQKTARFVFTFQNPVETFRPCSLVHP